MLENLKNYLNSEKGIASTKAFFDKLKKEKAVLDSQLCRFHNRIKSKDDFAFYVQKVIEKYDSSEYIESSYARGHMPEEKLYFFLFEYASKYGEQVTKEQYELYCNTFTVDAYIIHDYCFYLMNGQGSCIGITEIQ